MFKLVVTCERGQYFIQWEEDGDRAGYLCQRESDGLGNPPKDRDHWEHWEASRVVRGTKGFYQGRTGAFWIDEDLSAVMRNVTFTNHHVKIRREKT